MRTSTILFALLFSAAGLIFINCGGNKKGHEGHEDAALDKSAESSASADVASPQFTVDAKFQQQLSNVFRAYISVKEAFVNSDAANVSAQAAAARQSLAGADMKLLSGAAHNDWMNYLSAMETSLKEMESSSDIESQREAFSKLSENLYKSIKAYGLGGTTAYYDFCPMAFNNQGGFWLSNAKEIRNPYFGDEMLSCGSVQEVLK
jgi:Cu(I)/Ag(I) efflux system membrane fusion protein